MKKNKNKLSWRTRARLLWDVLTRGQYDPRDYKTIHEEEQWAVCEQRRKELEASTRPRKPFAYRWEEDEQ